MLKRILWMAPILAVNLWFADAPAQAKPKARADISRDTFWDRDDDKGKGGRREGDKGKPRKPKPKPGPRDDGGDDD
jgi:hypothetical protein